MSACAHDHVCVGGEEFGSQNEEAKNSVFQFFPKIKGERRRKVGEFLKTVLDTYVCFMFSFLMTF